MLAQGHGSYGAPTVTRVRIARPGRDTPWTPVSVSGPTPPVFTRPVGLLDPESGRLLVQGDGEGDVYASSDERLFAFTLLNPVLAAPEAGNSRRVILEAYPNPAQGVFHLRGSLARPGPVEIEVFDVTGPCVAARSEPALGTGSRALVIGSPRDPLRAGLYLVRVRVAGTIVTRRIAILR